MTMLAGIQYLDKPGIPASVGGPDIVAAFKLCFMLDNLDEAQRELDEATDLIMENCLDGLRLVGDLSYPVTDDRVVKFFADAYALGFVIDPDEEVTADFLDAAADLVERFSAELLADPQIRGWLEDDVRNHEFERLRELGHALAVNVANGLFMARRARWRRA